MLTKRIFTQFIFALMLLYTDASAGLPKCYGVSDQTNKMWFMVPNPGASPLPSSVEISLEQSYKAEGAAYRASTKQMYLFDCVGDNEGPCDLHEYTIDFTNNTANKTIVKTNITNASTGTGGGGDSVEGATFYIDPVNGKEYLYATVGENGSKIYKWETSNWTIEAGYPKNLSGDISTITGIAYDPSHKKFYGSKDNTSPSNGTSDKADIFEINMDTGVTTFVTEVNKQVDAEGLTYAADGLLYTEDDAIQSRTIYTLDPNTGAMIAAANFLGNADAESLACNAGERSDFGDAPSSYGYAVHSLPVFDITPHAAYIGTNAPDDDNDIAGQASDTASNDSDDGVTLAGISLQNQTLKLGQDYTLTIATHGTQQGYLNAWIDFNHDGDFNDANEQIATNLTPQTGAITLTLHIPDSVTPAQTFARFRYATQQNLPPSDNLSLDQEAPDGEVEDYKITLSASGTVKGFVKDNYANPIENVSISLRVGTTIINDIHGNPLTTTTDENGSYVFENVPVGDYLIIEEDKAHYTSQSDTASHDNDTVANTNTNDNVIPVTLTDGEVDINNNFTDMTPISTISGNVTEDNNQPLSGVTIRITDSNNTMVNDIDGNPLTTQTDAQGNYSFTKVPAGEYIIKEINHAQYTSISDIDAANDDMIHITVSNAQNYVNQNFVDTRIVNRISGIVKTNNNRPIFGAKIKLIDAQLAQVAQTSIFVTQEDGLFYFDNIPAGNYFLLEVDAAKYNSVKDIAGDDNASNTNTNDNIIPVTLTAQEMDTDNVFIDEQNLSIQGRVLADDDFDDVADKPLSDVRIELLDASSGLRLQHTVTDSNGTYIFHNISEGNYTIKEIDPEGYASLRDKDGDDKNLILVTVTDSDVIGQNFEDQKRIVVAGNVQVDVDGDNVVDVPLKNAEIVICQTDAAVCDASHYLFKVLSDDDGNYKFDQLVPGDYVIVQLEKEGYESLRDVDGANDNKIYISLKPNGFDVNDKNFDDKSTIPTLLEIRKEVRKQEAHIGDFVSYTISVENTSNGYTYSNVIIKDTLPAGFKYEPKSAYILRGKQKTTLGALGNDVISFGTFTLAPKEKVTLSYLLKVGISVAQGKHINKAVANQNGKDISNLSTATVHIIRDAFMDNAIVIGKVFFDKNENGIQDCCEKGIPGVRLATVEGMLIETDAHGRYHVADAASTAFGGRGSNFIVKVDPATLPEGTRFTTENPRVYRLSSGQLNVINFGVVLPESKAFSKERIITKVTMKKTPVSEQSEVHLGSIYFDSDQFCIRPDQVKTLCNIAQHIKEYGNGALKIEGNTDARAPMWYNKKLAYKRAKNVYNELRVQLGDRLMKHVEVVYDNCEREVRFDPRYDWWGKKNIPRSKKECTAFGISHKECQRALATHRGGTL